MDEDLGRMKAAIEHGRLPREGSAWRPDDTSPSQRGTERPPRVQRVARYRDRVEAGRELALRLGAYAGRDDVVVLGLPRGGVPVAAEVAHALGAPLDVFVVRKLGVPGTKSSPWGQSRAAECAS
jgi:hypothetical protein